MSALPTDQGNHQISVNFDKIRVFYIKLLISINIKLQACYFIRGFICLPFSMGHGWLV